MSSSPIFTYKRAKTLCELSIYFHYFIGFSLKKRPKSGIIHTELGAATPVGIKNEQQTTPQSTGRLTADALRQNNELQTTNNNQLRSPQDA